MNVKVRPRTQGSGGLEVDIMVCTPDGTRIRKRLKSPLPSKSGSKRWGEERARHLALYGDTKKQADPPKKEVPKLAEFAPEFLAYLATSLKPSSLRTVRTVVEYHLVPAFGNLRLHTIDTKAIDTYIVDKLLPTSEWTKPRKGNGKGKRRGKREAEPRLLKPRSVHNHLDILVRLLRVAYKWDLIVKVPEIERPRLNPPEFRYLDFDEADLYLETVEKRLPEWHSYVLTSMRTGLRRGEMLALRWRHIDLKRRVVRVQANWTPEGGFGTPKNGKARDVPLTREVVEVLLDHRIGDDGDLVFPGEGGDVLSHHKLGDTIARASQLAGIPHVHPHALRHTFASHCGMREIPILQVKEWMGHHSVTQTMRYAHLSGDFGRNMIERLDPSSARPELVQPSPLEECWNSSSRRDAQRRKTQ